MFTLNKNNLLEGTLPIRSQRSYLEIIIEEPKDNVFFFRTKKNNKVCSFNQLNLIKDNIYSCSITYTTDMESTIDKYTADIVISNGQESIYSNEIPVIFNRDKIHGEITQANIAELISIKEQMAILSKQVDMAFSSRIPKAIPEFNKENCKKGMIPTVISDDGTIAFTYPFSDILNEINGKKSVMRKIVLDASDIKLYNEDVTIDYLIKTLRENQRKESDLLKEISKTLSILTQKVASLEETLVDFRNNQ